METISTSEIAKVDKSLGLVFGWAIICKKDGEEYFDVQGHNIPEDAMMEATLDFAKSQRIMCDMHGRNIDANGAKTPTNNGQIVFMMPMTADVAKAFGIETDQTGLMVAAYPDDPEVLAKFESGEYTGFSIGGHHLELEDVVDA